MGLNAYASAIGSKGLTTGATAAGAVIQIPGKPGGRLGILAYGATCGSAIATSLHILTTLYASSIAAAGGASGVTSITTAAFTAAPSTAGNICVVLDNGTYQFLTVASTASTTVIPISSALTGISTLGAVYYLGLNTDTTGGVQNIALAAAVQKTDSSDLGRIWSNFKGAPMIMQLISAGATAQSSIDYVDYAYTNV